MPTATLKERISDIVAGTNIGALLDNLRLITPDLQDRGLPDLATVQGQQEVDYSTESAYCFGQSASLEGR